MKCAICGIEEDTIENAISSGWVPLILDGNEEKEGPFCASCCEILTETHESGEFMVKKEFQKKIIYQEGDFFGEDFEDDDTIGIIFEYCEN